MLLPKLGDALLTFPQESLEWVVRLDGIVAHGGKRLKKMVDQKSFLFVSVHANDEIACRTTRVPYNTVSHS